jgi:ATP-dependent DNA ligase
MPLNRRAAPFNHLEWMFELKYDDFRSGPHQISSHTTAIPLHLSPASQTQSRHRFANEAVLDGEIVCPDLRGHPLFDDLLFRRREPCYFAFDLLWSAGKDHGLVELVDRKRELKSLLSRVPDGTSQVRRSRRGFRRGTL